jgi:soluble lytic murein transglycosylase
VFLACLLVVLHVGPIEAPRSAAAAEVFYYVDRDGTAHFTNVPTDSRFRKLEWHTMSAGPRRLQPPISRSRLDRTIIRQSEQHRLDPALLRAVIKAESDFDPVAVSKAGAVGLMQLMPRTALRLEVRDPYDPEENIGGGARYLRYLLDRFRGNLALALAAYNAGENRVERYQALPPIAETLRYVTKVLRFYQSFRLGERSSRFSTISPAIPLRSDSSVPLGTGPSAKLAQSPAGTLGTGSFRSETRSQTLVFSFVPGR